MKNQTEIPNVLDFTDFRKFLKNYYEAMKASTPYFSYRYFSKLAGFASPNFFKLVAEGNRNLSSHGIQKFCKALKLGVKETRYFRLLVLKDQAQNPEEKDYFTRQLLKSKIFKTIKPITEAQYDYYSEWYHIPLRELIGRSDFNNDPKWIASQFTPPISEKEAREGLETLLKLGLIEATPEGSFRQVDTSISTGDEVTSFAVSNYHRRMIALGAESIERFPAAERDVSSLSMGMTKATAAKVKKMIQDFRKEIIAVVNQDTTVEEIMQFNMQYFPLTTKKGEGDEE